MLYGFKYDGRHSSEFNLTVTSVRRKLHAPIKPRLVSVPQKPGAYNYGKPEIGHLVFEVSVLFTAQDNRSFHDLRRDIAAWLYRDKEVELVFDEEPDKYYMAQFSEESDIDRLGTAGSTTLYFVSSDPYAFGKTKTQRIANPYVVFQREGIRYREDGTEVTENYPVYKPGKFDQAILVEEGTENLLPSASAPAKEELSLPVGEDYFLTTVNGTAKIEHKKAETVNRELEKEGINFSKTIDTEWENGSFFNVELVDGDFLRLSRAGTNVSVKYDTQDEWNNEENELRNTVGDASGRLIIDDLPQWEVIDPMTDYTNNWKIQGGSGTITQGPNYVTIKGSSVSSSFGIDSEDKLTVVFPVTMDFKFRGRDVTNVQLLFEDGAGTGFTVDLDDDTNTWVWYRFISDGNTATLYKNGTEVTTVDKNPSSSINQIQFFITSGGSGDFDIGQVYIDWGYSKGAPPENNEYVGSWVSWYRSLDQVKTALSSLASYSYGFDGEAEDFLVDIESQIVIGGLGQGWSRLINNESIPGIAKGDDLSDTSVQLKITLKTRDPGRSPYINFVRMDFESGYNASGRWESPVFDISQVGKAAQTMISWINDSIPSGTNAQIYVRISEDNGDSWGDWISVENPGPIPGVTQETDLSSALLQGKIELSTADIGTTPSIDSFSVSLKSGYKPSQTFFVSPVDVSAIGVAADSVVKWTALLPELTDVIVEISLDSSEWTTVTNGGSIVANGSDLTGKELHIRYTLLTSDTNFTPVMESFEWSIEQADSNRISPVTGTIILTPNNVDRWQLENKPYATGWHAYGTPRNNETAYVPTELSAKGTIELWAREDSRSLQKDRFIFDAEGVLSLRKGADNNYLVKVDGSDALTIAPPSAGWHYWAVRWDETAVDVFLDGESVATLTLDSPLDLGAVDRLFIGCSDTRAQWNELLDDLRISFVPRSDEEIAAAFESGKPTETDDYTDYKFAFDGSLAPTVDISIEIGGTAPTQGIFTATFINKAPYFKISNEIEYVQVDVEFEPGDILEIDCVREVVRKNGSRLEAMPFVHLDSDFFDLIPGGTVFVEPEGAAKVDATFTERWR